MKESVMSHNNNNNNTQQPSPKQLLKNNTDETTTTTTRPDSLPQHFSEKIATESPQSDFLKPFQFTQSEITSRFCDLLSELTSICQTPTPEKMVLREEFDSFVFGLVSDVRNLAVKNEETLQKKDDKHRDQHNGNNSRSCSTFCPHESTHNHNNTYNNHETDNSNHNSHETDNNNNNNHCDEKCTFLVDPKPSPSDM